MTRKQKTLNSKCPECDAKVILASGVKRGQRVICDTCHSELVLINPADLILDWAFVEPLKPVAVGKRGGNIA
jgi:ribosomal protein S27AE